MSDYEVIIVGGRPSGSTLAARLGQAGIKVLLLERSTLPSLPAASCPIIYASTMRLLDEIGADEAAYARNTPKLRKMLNVLDEMTIEMPIPDAFGRDYAYSIDRARFDAALWDTALSYATVEGRMGFSAVNLLREGERVIGIIGHGADRVEQSITADLVVGADGRHSFVGRVVNAAEKDAHDEYPTSLYYAYWKNAAPFGDGTPQVVALGNGDGYGVLMMDSADGTLALGVEGRTERINPEPGQIEAKYLELIREFPLIWKRVQHAEMVTGVRGIKNVGNLYRIPGGEGWALAGDAFHQKDPLDGQGIYDAMYTSRALAAEVIAWKQGEKSWKQALNDYEQVARAETYPMYMSTLERVRSNLYSDMPDWALEFSKRTWMRWLFEDTVFQEQIGKMLTRQIKPNEAMSAPVVIGAILRGPLRELSRALERQIER